MSIQKKILFFFSTVAIGLTALSLLVIHTLFYEFREEEFQQRQKQKITQTLTYLSSVKEMDSGILSALDEATIQRIYDEKLLIYNSDRELIYESLDDTAIPYAGQLLDQLGTAKPWLEKKDELYDVVGLYFESDGKAYYGVSKAFDAYGYSKLNYLRAVLLINFLFFSMVIIWVSFYLSKRISKPIVEIARTIDNYDFEANNEPIELTKGNKEMDILAARFNELMQRTREAFAFQKQAVHHISHELKTPVTILVSNFEKMEKEDDTAKLREMLLDQKEDTKTLSEIIDALLEISKVETTNHLHKKQLRLDELVFDIAGELSNIYPDFEFRIEYSDQEVLHESLTVMANERLIRLAIGNIMINAIQYSPSGIATLLITGQNNGTELQFRNHGPVISSEERKYLFQRFFRGTNSAGKRGFGLGLVLIKKIAHLHGGDVTYRSENKRTNIFVLSLPRGTEPKSHVPLKVP